MSLNIAELSSSRNVGVLDWTHVVLPRSNVETTG